MIFLLAVVNDIQAYRKAGRQWHDNLARFGIHPVSHFVPLIVRVRMAARGRHRFGGEVAQKAGFRRPYRLIERVPQHDLRWRFVGNYEAV